MTPRPSHVAEILQRAIHTGRRPGELATEAVQHLVDTAEAIRRWGEHEEATDADRRETEAVLETLKGLLP